MKFFIDYFLTIKVEKRFNKNIIVLNLMPYDLYI